MSDGHDRPRALVIVNPHATGTSGRLRRHVLEMLARGLAIEAASTRERGHAIELARDAAREGFDLVIAFGGDGTANEAANGVIGSSTALGCLPAGATNVFCRLLGLPRDVLAATNRLLAHAGRLSPRLVDTGRVDDRHFLFASGVGLDARMVATADRHPRQKARLGHHYFAAAAAWAYLREYLVGAPRIRVDAAGRRLEGVTAIVQNGDPASFYGRRAIRIAPDAGLQTGSLSLAVLARATPLDMVALAPRLFGEGAAGHPQVSTLAAMRTARVSACEDVAFPLEVDGDYLGEFERVHYSAAPRSLAVLA